jgi:hypothetical protein
MALPTDLLPPTSADVLRDDARPYFLWWTDLSVAAFRERLKSADPSVRAYWMGALLREANTRDVWHFVRPRDIEEHWPLLGRYLGRARRRWAFLLGLPEHAWPPARAGASSATGSTTGSAI